MQNSPKGTEESKLILRDWLAVERTKLANERTFLAYFRSAIAFFITGISLLKISYFSDLKSLAIGFLVASPIILIFGIYRLVKVKKWIEKHYKE
ncbi:putative membrane protein [Spirosomataceae bacterium TFI 002]|nr:putative membrane protein [Spirosomataceae bacterium TFI 002]